MKIKKRIKFRKIIIVIAMFLCLSLEVRAKESTKIHFISLNNYTDAILLESNGHFGLVDSGEDWDYPNGKNYPFHQGTSMGVGYEQQVIHYLEKMGVEKLDFYIATHSHSDHIGSGDEIIHHFEVDRLYIAQYNDTYMLDFHGKDVNDPYYFAKADENNLWDNQYVYDNIIRAAKENNVQVITDLDLEENALYRKFKMGDMDIEILNYEIVRDEQGNVVPVASENNNCYVVKVSALGKEALLTSDIDPLDGDIERLVDYMVNELKDFRLNSNEGEKEDITIEESEPDSVQIEMDITEQRSKEAVDYAGSLVSGIRGENGLAGNVNLSSPNTGDTITIDLMKMSHHSLEANNPVYMLTSFNPKNVVITGPMANYSYRQQYYLPNTNAYSTNTMSAAVVATFEEERLKTEYVTLEAELYEIDGELYYFDEYGRTLKEGVTQIEKNKYLLDKTGMIMRGWSKKDGNTYYTDEQTGEMMFGWQEIDGKYYYFHENGIMAKDARINDFYVDENGVMVPDYNAGKWMQKNGMWWYQLSDGSYYRSCVKYINNKWYYFDASGWMKTGWAFVNEQWYFFDNNGGRVEHWYNINGKWYYFNDMGMMQTGWQYVDDEWYYLTSSGEMQIGWANIDEKWYYFTKAGVMQTDWQKIDGYWYYFNVSGEMLNGWQEINDTWYYLNGSGKMQTGWQLISGQWYYFDKSGEMQTGRKLIDGVMYYFDDDGVMH